MSIESDLKKDGIKFIDNISDAEDITIIRAHGVPKEVYENTKNSNIEIKSIQKILEL